MKASQSMHRPLLRCGVRCEVCWMEEISHLLRGMSIYNVRARLVGKLPCRRMNLRAYLEVWVIFPYLCTRKRNERPSGNAGCLTSRDL